MGVEALETERDRERSPIDIGRDGEGAPDGVEGQEPPDHPRVAPADHVFGGEQAIDPMVALGESSDQEAGELAGPLEVEVAKSRAQLHVTVLRVGHEPHHLEEHRMPRRPQVENARPIAELGNEGRRDYHADPATAQVSHLELVAGGGAEKDVTRLEDETVRVSPIQVQHPAFRV